MKLEIIINIYLYAHKIYLLDLHLVILVPVSDWMGDSLTYGILRALLYFKRKIFRYVGNMLTTNHL
jgi:hypothetical protein